jgi:hypothetical protein
MSAPASGAETVLAQLMRQAAERGADIVTLRAIAEEAGEQAAARALARAGLSDEAARADLAELRGLLAAWRDARRGAMRAFFAWIGRAAVALLLAAMAVRIGWDRP